MPLESIKESFTSAVRDSSGPRRRMIPFESTVIVAGLMSP